MATRVTKLGNTKEFAQATQPWHIADLDSDLDAIFGQIDNTNIAVAANIATAKLASDAGIVAGMLGPGSVTTTKLADAPNGVTIGKLNVGAAINNAVFVDVAGGANASTLETPFATLPGFTARGGRVFIFGTIAWHVRLTNSSGAAQSVAMKLYRNSGGAGFGTAIATWNFSVLAQGAAEVRIPLTTPIWTEVPSAVSQVYELRANTSSAANPTVVIFTDGAAPGRLFAVELA